MVKVIHIAPDIGYLFPDTAFTATTLCGRLVHEILAEGDAVGIAKNLNPKLPVCPTCLERTNET